MAYHLVLPKLYLQRGRIGEIPWLLYSHWPHLIETSYSVFLAAKSDLAPALWHVVAMCAFLALVYHLGRLYIGRAWGLVAASVVAAQPVVARFGGTAQIDVWLGLFVLGAHHCAWRWRQERKKPWLIAAGLMAGFAAAAKLLGLIPLVMIAGWIVLQRRKSAHRCWREALAFVGCGMIVAGPWYVKTWIGAGNPVWPFFYPLLGGRWNPSVFLGTYLKSTRLPLPPTWYGITHYDPQYLILTPAIALLWSRARDRAREAVPPFLLFVLLCSLPYAALLASQLEFWRFFIPYFPALALLLAWYLSRLTRGDSLSVALGIALFATATAPIATLSQGNELFAVLEVRSAMFPGQSPRQVYLTRAFEPYPFFRAANKLLLAEPSKTLLFAMSEGYYFDAPYQWGSWYQGVLPYPLLGSADELAHKLQQMGITHIIVDRSRLPSESANARKLMDEVLAQRGNLLLQDGKYALYKVSIPTDNVERGVAVGAF